jgi:hypothetical protein
MTTEARIGWGGKLLVSTDDTEANLTEISEVRSVTFPQITTDEHEVTHLQSPDRFKEYIGGLKDGGEFTASLNYVPLGASDILLEGALGLTRKVRLIVPDDSGTGAADGNWTFSAVIKRYSPDTMEPNAPITATVTFRCAGQIEQGAGTAGS